MKKRVKMKIKANHKGITLISLIITIIILIILAGITLSLLLENNGIITKSKEAKNTHQEAAIIEKVQMALADYEAEKITKNETPEIDDALEYLQANHTFEEIDTENDMGIIENYKITLIKENKSILIGNIMISSDSNTDSDGDGDGGSGSGSGSDSGSDIEMGDNYVYYHGWQNPKYHLVQYKQRNGSSTIEFLEDTILVSTPNSGNSYHWGGIGFEEKVDITNYNRLVIKFANTCNAYIYLTNSSITDITIPINQETISGAEYSYNLSNYSGNYYIGMWPKYSVEIEEMYFE